MGVVVGLFRIVQALRYVSARQLYFIIRKRLLSRRIQGRSQPVAEFRSNTEHLLFEEGYSVPATFTPPSTFNLLGVEFDYESYVDWDDLRHGHLGCYCLNYFDWLNQSKSPVGENLDLILEFIDKIDDYKTGWEPYPISVRSMNWIKFLSRHRLDVPEVLKALDRQYKHLCSNIERHLGGNHLLENGFSILFGAFVFADRSYYGVARKILSRELCDQLQQDGGHYERCPSYHQLILARVLDAFQLVERNPDRFEGQAELRRRLHRVAQRMLAWLEAITFSSGRVPAFGDSLVGSSPSTGELLRYAARLKIDGLKQELEDSGFRFYKRGRYEIAINAGQILSDAIPGHSHSDVFTFELELDGCPMIIDTGTSVYAPGKIRAAERGTEAHNTFWHPGYELIDVWGAFRVGSRPKVRIEQESASLLDVKHDGRGRSKFAGRRKFQFGDDKIIVEDSFPNSPELEGESLLHFDSDLAISGTGNQVQGTSWMIEVDGATEAELCRAEVARSFCRRKGAHLLRIRFHGTVRTIIRFR